ncbi:MAG: imidazole glycerol phosphate synthase subunit HisH [Nitrospirae bacterium]|nr:MAG: imidazole glycerol phosphate synthase subunit HisH [Nitrospirota bacterium]
MIVIIDCGIGNVGSVAHALEYLGGKYFISGNRKDFESADALVLPGVGAFPAGMKNLREFGLVDEMEKQVLINKKPFMGICLGMQLLASDSTEGGFNTGLGWIEGHVISLSPEGNLRVPHVGWNDVKFDRSSCFSHNIDENAHFYFDHSFHLQCDKSLAIATCEYGGTLVAAIQRENIFATQFHPEKSQRNGLKVLRNFLNFVGKH